MRLCPEPAGATGILADWREIDPADLSSLTREEAQSLVGRGETQRRESASARALARALFATWGLAGLSLPRSSQGFPVGPPGFVLSLAHDSRFAAAAVAPKSACAAVGIDIEPAEPLPPELLDLVQTGREQEVYGADPAVGRLLFAVKEAVYKALNPLDGEFLDFGDVDVDLERRIAATRTGHAVAFRYLTTPRVVALAFVRQAAA